MSTSQPDRPLQPGDVAPNVVLDAITREGKVAIDDYRGRTPVLISLTRGLHCPYCRRRITAMAQLEPALREKGIDMLTVINTPILLVGIGGFVAVHLVESRPRRKRVEWLGQLASHVDLHRHQLAHRDLARPVTFVLCEFDIGQAEGAVRHTLGVGCGQQIGDRAITEIEARALLHRGSG